MNYDAGDFMRITVTHAVLPCCVLKLHKVDGYSLWETNSPALDLALSVDGKA
jgi:hypothetical protein